MPSVTGPSITVASIKTSPESSTSLVQEDKAEAKAGYRGKHHVQTGGALDTLHLNIVLLFCTSCNSPGTFQQDMSQSSSLLINKGEKIFDFYPTVGNLRQKKQHPETSKIGGDIMTLENVLTLVIILVLLVIAVREWMDILKRHPIFLTIVGVLITAYGLV